MKILRFNEFRSIFINEEYTYAKANEVRKKYAKLELRKTNADKAVEVAKEMLDDKFSEIYDNEETFKANYDSAKKLADKFGVYKRGEMPVINNSNFKGVGKGKEDDESAPRTEMMDDALEDGGVEDHNKRKTVMANQVLTLKFLLQHGFIDVIGEDKELAKKVQADLDKDEELSKKWLTAGGGDKKEQIGGAVVDIPVSKLKPIQEQIFFIKSIYMATPLGGKEEPTKEGMDWLLKPNDKSPITIVSKDKFILDGHHRWLGAYLVDPNSKMKCCVINMNKNELLELTNKFTGAIGNKPNVSD